MYTRFLWSTVQNTKVLPIHLHIPPHDISSVRFYKVGVDIMTFKNIDYLVVVDCYSKFPEMVVLQDKTALTVVENLKHIFARFGIPYEIISDNMPFQSRAFLTFSKEWGFKTTASSPNYPQSNGQVERTIQTLKRVLKKADYESKDPYLSLLEFRNTPASGLPYSPAQILMSKRLRSEIPCALSLLEPFVVNVDDSLTAVQTRQERYYNRGTKPLSTFKKGERVYCKQRNCRDQAVIVDADANPRSCVVQNQHGIVRHNRRHLFKASPDVTLNHDNHCVDDIEYNENDEYDSMPNPINCTRPNFKTSCYGRRISRPRRFQDYV